MSKFPFSQILENGVNRMLVVLEDWRNSRIIQLVAILVSILMIVPSADAVDALKTCACLLKECRVELAKCLANPSCAANIACLQTCNNRPDETECQVSPLLYINFMPLPFIVHQLPKEPELFAHEIFFF